jgi:hypothetical protein
MVADGTIALPPFNPALWVEHATRQIDLAEGSRGLLAALTAPETWQVGVDRDAQHRDVLQRLASVLRADTPLFLLTAAFIAPWLLDALADDETGETHATPVQERLVALLEYRYGRVSSPDYDPWNGLAEWLWSHQHAWAVAAMQRELGRDTVRAMPDHEYRRLIANYVARSGEGELRDRASQLLITYAQELSKVVVDALDLATITPGRRRLLLGHVPLRDPAALLPPSTVAPPISRGVVAPLLRDNHLAVIGADHYHALREAIYKNTFRRVDGQPWPTALLQMGDGLGEAQLRPPAADGQAILPPEQLDLWAEAMWRQREELSDLDADVLDELCALFLYQARTTTDRAVADIDGLLAMRGIRERHRGNGKRSGYEPEQRAEMQRAVARIQNIWINIATERDLDDPATTRVFQSRLFTMTERVGQLNLQGDLDIDRFVYRPGDLFANYLLGPGAKTTLLSARALKYDPYRQQLEKRLARFFSWQWVAPNDEPATRPGARRGPNWRAFQIGTLLDAAAKSIDRARPAVTRERLEHCLDTLLADEVIGAWQYQDWDEDLSRRHGWAESWRASSILVAPPQAVVAGILRAEATSALSGATMVAPAPDNLAASIKAQRLALGLNQREAAAALAISQGHYSKLERGALADHTPTAAFRERLAVWLAKPAT